MIDRLNACVELFVGGIALGAFPAFLLFCLCAMVSGEDQR